MGNKRRNWLLAIMAIAVILRLSMSVYLGETLNSPQQKRIFDQVSYNELAQSLVKGQGYSFEKNWYPFTPAHTPTAHWSFLYPFFLAVIYKLFGLYPLAARLVQAVLSGILSIWLYYRLGSRLFSQTVGLITAGLAAVYAYFVLYDAALMTESFFILSVLAMFELALQITEQNGVPYAGERMRKWFFLGFIIGFAALLRQTILLWLPFLYLWFVWVGYKKGRVNWKGIVLSIFVLMLLILPWTIRNYIVFHTFLPLNSNAGYALYSANHPHHGTHFDQDYAAPLPEDLRGQSLNEAQWNTALAKRGLEFIIQEPTRYLLLSLDRVTVFFNFWFTPETGFQAGLIRLLSYGLYLPFMLLGLALSWPQRHKYHVIYLFIFVFSLIHILTWASVRYRLPIDAVLMPFAALAFLKSVDRVRGGTRIRLRALKRGLS